MVWGPSPGFAYALIAAVSVLVIIVCPYALGLVTPMWIMVGEGATAGALIKNVEALERFEKVDMPEVDRTGTLTEGKPRVAVPTLDFDEVTKRPSCRWRPPLSLTPGNAARSWMRWPTSAASPARVSRARSAGARSRSRTPR
jgi:hypothetical protein